MDFVSAIKSGFNGYVNFSGRSCRSELWFWALFNFIANSVAITLDILGGAGLFLMTISLVLLLPSIALQVRRMHDLNKSGWWVLIVLIPLIGAIIVLVWMCSKGTEGSNRFGPDPLSDIFA